MLIDLTEQEIGLVRAGLAAHAIAMDNPAIRAALAASDCCVWIGQQAACRDLSTRLAEAAQNAQEEA